MVFARSCFLFLLCLSSWWTGSAQSTFRISGKIVADDLSPLANVSVFVSQFSTGSLTDSVGQFHVLLKPGLQEISFSYVGYIPVTISLLVARDTFLEVIMKTDLQLHEITITDRKQSLASLHEADGTITLRQENFNSLPAFLGENDPMRAVQMQPGVQSGNEGARGIFIRGGSPDQNLMLLDGATVYNPSHIYGFISVFNGDAIDHLNVYKEHYPSRFGGRLCSVLDVHLGSGNTQKIKGSFSFGLVSSKIHVDGPIDKQKKLTFSFSARGCYVGLYAGPISRKQYKAAGYDGSIYYYFGDVNTKAAYRFTDKTILEFGFFSNNDIYSFKKELKTSNQFYSENGFFLQRIHWANYVASFALSHVFNEQWKIAQQVSFSRYQLRSTDKDNYHQTNYFYNSNYTSLYSLENKSYINDYTTRTDLTFSTSKQSFTMGGGVSGLFFETGKGKLDYDNTYFGKEQIELKGNLIKSADAFVYAEDEYHPDEKWLINGGFHARLYTVNKKIFASLLPRLNVLYNPAAKFYLRASAAGVSQNTHLLAAASSNILNDYWVPATTQAKPETGWNFSSGMTQKLPLGFEWSVDGFYRIMNNIIEYKTGVDKASVYQPWEQQIISGGRGRSYGAEFYLARSKGRVTGSVAYTLSWSERKFSALNEGKFFPYKYDRRHNLAVQLVVLVGRHVELGAAYVYGSGNMFTLAYQSYQSWGSVATYDYLIANNIQPSNGTEPINLYSGRNNYRLPSFQHLDVSVTYRKKVKNLEHAFNLSIYNVYNHFNIFSVYSDYRTNEDGSRSAVFKKLTLFPVLPSLSYTIKFQG